MVRSSVVCAQCRSFWSPTGLRKSGWAVGLALSKAEWDRAVGTAVLAMGRAAGLAAIAEHTSLIGIVSNPGGLPLYLDDLCDSCCDLFAIPVRF
jgi:hypothetical protein